MEYDLISLGLRLRWVGDGTGRLNWRDLLVIVREAPRSSALMRHLLPEGSQWSVDSYLLAGVLDALQARLWQAGGGKGKKPDPVDRPDDKRDDLTLNPTGDQSGVFRGESTSMAEMDEWMARRRARNQ